LSTRHRPRAVHRRASAWAAACLVAFAPAAAQAQDPTRAASDSLRLRMRALEAQVDSLRTLIMQLRQSGQAAQADTAVDALARIRAAAAAAAGTDTLSTPETPPRGQEFVSRQRNLSVLNPEISVTGNLFALVDSRSAGSDNFVAREFELSFISNLDPYSRAKIFVAHHSPGGEVEPFVDPDGSHEEESEVEVEEGYVEWVDVKGLGVTVGKFRQRFGRFNRWHQHALPGQQLPLPYVAFFGEEGLAQTGVSVHWLLPVHGFGTWELWGEATRSGNEELFGESRRISGLAHLNAFWQVSPAVYFELGASGLTGSYLDEDGERSGRRVGGLDFTLDWRPPAMARYRSASLSGGVVLNRSDFDEGPTTAIGGFAIGEYQLAQQWYVGARWEYTENQFDTSQHTWLAAPTLTWWQSEYVRLRAEYDFVRRPDARYGQFLIQTTLAMGPHKHETY
jgi:hypothetical protein